MSGNRSVPFSKDLPPPLVPLPSCHARVKQLQAQLFNEVPLTTSYIANCRLCLGNNFSERSTTIIEERFCTMLQHVFPFPIPNEIGLPMNVCADCYKSVQIFNGYIFQVQINQQKLQESLMKAEHLDYTDINNAMLERAQYPISNREAFATAVKQRLFVSGGESQENYENEILIDTVQCKMEDDEINQGQDPLSQSSYCNGKSLRTASSETPKDHMRDGLRLVQCKANPDGSYTKHKNATPSLMEHRKKDRYLSKESGRKPLEQNVIEHVNRLGPLHICSTCNQTFDQHDQLICHQKTHMMKECPICNQLIQYTLLAKHVIHEHADRYRREQQIK